MNVIPNKKLSYIPPVTMDIDSLEDLPFIPSKPLPSKSFAFLIVGQPGSGKTTLWNSLLLSHPTKKKPNTPKFLYKLFDHIYLISPSLQTLPLNKLNLNPDRMFNQYTDQLLEDILELEKDGENLNNLIIIDDSVRDLTRSKVLEDILEEEMNAENLNNLIIIDDSVRDLTRSKVLCRTILNRRHCTQNNDEEGKAGLSIMITSQKYNMVPMALRLNMSNVIVFRSENQRELDTIKNELLGDLTKDQQNELLKTAWKEPYDFLFIDNFKPKKERYFRNFDKIEIPE